MTTTMQLIAKQTVGAGGAASVTFSNIPQTYTDLKLVVSGRTTSTGNYFSIYPNGSSANASNRRIYGNGSTVASYNDSILFSYVGFSSQTANTFGSSEVYIPNYTSSNYKSMSIDAVSENNASNAEASLIAGLWSSTSAITSLQLVPSAANFAEYSEFWLYGISNSTTTQATTVPYASGGDVITTDGSYWYHAFKYSGSFTPLKNLTADVLVVAGGGGGGGTHGGGGGAGGLLYSSAQALISAINYTCTIGSGGTGGSSSGGRGNNGANSVFNSLTAVGGGGGGSQFSGQLNGSTGGSGGGGGSNGTAGSATSGQGNNGGAGYTGTDKGGGGGGGAGAAGDAATSSSGYAGAGGNGTNTYASWLSATNTGEYTNSSYYIAGGGAGGDYSFYATGSNIKYGGYGGGGGGSRGTSPGYTIVNGTAGIANTGGGGCGGTGNGGAGQNGGSGIIIVRYAV